MSVCHPDWRDAAACRGMAAGLFFLGRGEPNREARATCAACPVAVQCLEHALTQPETYGMWGGKSERELRRLRKARTLRRAA